MQLVAEELERIGVDFELTRRGALLGALEGRDTAHRTVVVHADTIGCIVKRLKENGRLQVVPVGTHSARFAEGAYVTIFVDDISRSYSGTILPLKASGHRYGQEIDIQGVGWDHVEVRVDEPVRGAEDLAALGIKVGDFVAFDASPVVTPSGFVKSRHLDDKAGVAAALGAFRTVVDHRVALPVGAHLLVTIAEEVGLGASHGLDGDVAELVSVDNAVVAPGQESRENTVNVAMLDSSGPFDYHLTRRLLTLASRHGIPARRDVFDHYRSDLASALVSGVATRVALLGFGVDASHGYERTHLDGIRHSAELVALYLQTGLTFGAWDEHEFGPLSDFPSSSQPAAEAP
jgi:peptidase M42 family hydrolase